MSRMISQFVAFAAIHFSLLPASAVTIETVPVGDPGNAHDQSYMANGLEFGAVAYNYRIGTYEVSNAQYAEFLNAKAASDPLALYNTSMGSDARGGIVRAGSSGSYTYATKANMSNKPVNFVSWFDALRFTNWLDNGQGSGNTESGAYTLNGGTAHPSNALTITRNSGANWFLPTEDEWYKAAFYQPAVKGGDTDSYWLYPTATNVTPTAATANSSGEISNPGDNVANFFLSADWNGQNGNVTTVGSAGSLSTSYYGTYDQGGNVWEWNETTYQFPFPPEARDTRGGAWDDQPTALRSSGWDFDTQSHEDSTLGFRVATIPEPSTFALAGLGLVSLVALHLRRKR